MHYFKLKIINFVDDDCKLIQFSRSKLIVLINFKQEKKIFLYEDEQLKSLVSINILLKFSF